MTWMTKFILLLSLLKKSIRYVIERSTVVDVAQFKKVMLVRNVRTGHNKRE